MKIQPMPDHIQIELDTIQIAGLDTSSKESQSEIGTVIAIGCNVPANMDLHPGDRILFKAWGVDIHSVGEDDRIYLIDYTNNCIGGKVIDESNEA